MAGERAFQIHRLGPPRQRVEMERNRDQHSLSEISDRRDEQRGGRQSCEGRDFRHMLMFEAERVKLERRRLVRLISLDHLAPAPGIARDGVNRHRHVGGDKTGVDERAQQRYGARRITAGVGHARRVRDFFGLSGREFGEAIDPARRHAMRGRRVEQTRRALAQFVAELDRLARGVVGQAQDRQVDAGEQIALGARILALLRAIETISKSLRPASRSRISNPVVPESPSMKILGMVPPLRNVKGRPDEPPFRKPCRSA